MNKKLMRWIVFLTCIVSGGAGNAIGLGSLRMQSGLNQALRASIPLIGVDNLDVSASCIKAMLESLDGIFIDAPQISLMRNMQSTTIMLSLRQAIHEPALKLTVDVGCNNPIRREYKVLLDPVSSSSLGSKEGEQRKEQQKEQEKTFDFDSSQNLKLHNMPTLSMRQSDANANQDELAIFERKMRRSSRSSQSNQSNQKNSTNLTNSTNLANNKTQDVLKLSSGGSTSGTDNIEIHGDYRLKLAEKLSRSPLLAGVAEIRAAQIQFAAILRGEDPVKNAEIQVKQAQVKMEALQTEVTRLTMAHQLSEDLMFDMQQKLFSYVWILVLGGLLLISIGVIVWLSFRLSVAQRMGRAHWWEGKLSPREEKYTEQEEKKDLDHPHP